MAKMDKGVLTGKPVTYPIPSPAGGVRCLRGRDLTPLDLSDPEHPMALWAEQREVRLDVKFRRPTLAAAKAIESHCNCWTFSRIGLAYLRPPFLIPGGVGYISVPIEACVKRGSWR